ncbi:DUF4914 family protein [Salinispira pacifica]|uniref:DUF4914 domain-containing protein n=1 Tax=Salinispira pacifica TaxID=1307761 RepID=V5WD17_9SPIO|nr:DUF4914 family protein [Salinispira pacifica]AHC13495.1 hypothetical protein L21SP2_0049 [Salinispira pacifica]
MKQKYLNRLNVSSDIREILENNHVILPESRQELLDLTFQGRPDEFEVSYDIPGKGKYVEARVTRCKNGASVNYTEAYMRRRDPNAMLIADEKPTDKETYSQRYGTSFDPTRTETMDWFNSLGEVVVLPFLSGNDRFSGYPSLLIAPSNAGFFVTGLADLQGFIPASQIPEDFSPRAVLYVAPPFRHTHFDGKQVVVHNRTDELHELFCYNLYPGPSAKKGVYGVLLTIGEEEHWTTLHSSAVRLVTPYDNEFVILHEGASGGGKSEMTQAIHRESDGRILMAKNTVTKDDFYLELHDTCDLHPIADDMAIAHHAENGKLIISDAENGWFLRVDHLNEYGKEPYIEKLCIDPPEPLIYLNIDGKPGATALIWEHTMDEPGKPCPNPRVIMPRKFVDNTVEGKVSVDVRSFGVRTPPATREKPSYGIIGMMHILPPALGWLWRLVAPRGHANPSIVATKGLSSEGVGSYWPFATGKRVNQANILLDVTRNTPETDHILIPNQYIGAYHVGFKAEWIVREYVARRGSVKFREGQLVESRCPLLGYTLPNLRVNGQTIPHTLLHVQDQTEVGKEGYDAGAKILGDFFKQELEQYLTPELDPMGRKIIELVMNDAGLEELVSVMEN